MATTSGFFNGVNHDRRYDAMQVAQLFDGLIRDGVFGSIGTCFVVKPNSGRIVNVGVGRAWFNHTWTYNDSVLPLTMPLQEVLMDRIDAIVIDVDWTEAVRANSIKIIKGTPSMNPVKPPLARGLYHNQYPLAYVRSRANVTNIGQADIENCVGTSACPLVSGILQVISLDELIPQWRAILDDFVSTNTTSFKQWETAVKNDFLAWGNDLKEKLGEIPAVNLQLQIEALSEANYRYYDDLHNRSLTVYNGRISESSDISTYETTITRPNTSQVVFTNTITPKEGNMIYKKVVTTTNASGGIAYSFNERYSFDYKNTKAIRLGTYTGSKDLMADVDNTRYDVENSQKDLIDNSTFIITP